MLKNTLRYLLYYIKAITPIPIVKKNKLLIEKILDKKDHKIRSNKQKFYLISLSPGAGFFSNFGYVLNHLRNAEKMNLSPIIDMKNFPTHYNEPSKIYSTKNAWEYYFKSVSKKDLNKIYKDNEKVFIAYNNYPKFYDQNFGNKKIFKEIKK